MRHVNDDGDAESGQVPAEINKRFHVGTQTYFAASTYAPFRLMN